MVNNGPSKSTHLGTKFEIKTKKSTQWDANKIVTSNIHISNKGLPSTSNSHAFNFWDMKNMAKRLDWEVQTSKKVTSRRRLINEIDHLTGLAGVH